MNKKYIFFLILSFIFGLLGEKFGIRDIPITSSSDFIFILPTVILILVIGIIIFPITVKINPMSIWEPILNKKIYTFREMPYQILCSLFAGLGVIISLAVRKQQISLIGSILIISSLSLFIGIKRIKKKYGNDFFKEN
ncbi:hypothetical protein KA977_15105 [Candidatus Dependentiae bacterium]|nr:hypothetical protein [Candidatus Dependentiae bacterium]